MKLLTAKYHLLVFGIFLIAAILIRLWAIRSSTGPDIAQFWAFATVFHNHGIDFYRYASVTDISFPFNWSFCYPPIWLLIIGLCLLATPDSQATGLMVSTDWRIAIKIPIIAADIAIGCLLFWAIPGSKIRRLVFSFLWLFHPAAWYNSAIFGQFDPITAALILTSILLLERGKDWQVFLVAGLAIMTKQHALIPLALMVVAIAPYLDKRHLIKNILVAAGVVIIISLPFLVTGNLPEYIRSILFSAYKPDYQPLMYAFNGIGSLLTYFHDVFGWETKNLLFLNVPILIIAFYVAAVFIYVKRIMPLRAILVGLCLFIALFYRINYQYLILYMPIALLIASRTPYLSERIITLGLTLVPAVWIWLYDVAFWFHRFGPVNHSVFPILDALGLDHFGTPDYAYVIVAMTLMVLSLVYVMGVFLRWRKPL